MTEWRELNETAKDIWETNAANWDDYMGAEGNRWHLELVRPGTERLLGLRSGQHVLDIACGNGNFSRRLARLGVRVTAFDFSKTLVERARARSEGEWAERITYRIVDATDYDALLALGKAEYDAAVANMALMDISDIAPLARALRALLKPRAPFVFSVSHPCFQTPGQRIVREVEDVGGQLMRRSGVFVWRYIEPEAHRGAAIPNEPVPSSYFHRPLSLILMPFFEQGFVVDALEEPAFEAEENPAANPNLGQSSPWTSLAPAIIVRMVRA